MEDNANRYILTLYITGETQTSRKTITLLEEILDSELHGMYELKIIDVLKHPQLAEDDKILATPTLIKILPPPVRKIIGELTDKKKILLGLDFTTK